jgi:ABC-type spermidine/putrescine transport system permease subunit I
VVWEPADELSVLKNEPAARVVSRSHLDHQHDVLFLAPLAIILGYSFLTRGVYGGITSPWTSESYQRLIDPIYLAILWRSFWVAGASTRCACCRISAGAVHLARGPAARTSISAW